MERISYSPETLFHVLTHFETADEALRAGKNVVSSNKYLMCRYYDELTALAKEHGAALRCTAAAPRG